MADDAAAEEARARMRARLPATSAIRMQLDSDSEDDDGPGASSTASDASVVAVAPALPLAASPGVGSYVTRPDSWRGVPPPMLAGSFDARLRPSLRAGPPHPPRPHRPARPPAFPSRIPEPSPTPRRRDRPPRPPPAAPVDITPAPRRSPSPSPPPLVPVSPSSQWYGSVGSESADWEVDDMGLEPEKQAEEEEEGRQVAEARPAELLQDTVTTAGTIEPTGEEEQDEAALEESLRRARAASHALAVSHARAHAELATARTRARSAAQAHERPPTSAKLAALSTQWRAIMGAPRELWIIFLLKFLSSYAYFAFALILTMFLTQEFGLSDSAAGWAYGMYGVMSTVFGFVCGWVIDYLGVRASLLIGAVVGAVSRLILALTPSHRTALFMLYTALPFSECLGIPIMTIGIKRYTNSHNRTFSFSLFYSMMNVAALCVGPLVDLSRSRFAGGVTLDLRRVGFEAIFQLSSLRIIVLTSSLATAAMMLGVVTGIRDIEVDDYGNVTRFEPDRSTSPYQQTLNVLREKAFWRLTVFTLLIVGVRLVFRHLDATMPKYLVRQFGPYAPFGLVYSINPMLVIWLVPAVGLFTRHIDSFDMILWGSFLAALSPFWICIGPHYWTVVLFMVTLSIGEAVYSPRVYEYTMEVAGRGVEGLYSSLSTAPLFSVKLLVGGMSGWLLTNFMPANDPGARRGGLLWGIVALTSLTSPLLMILLRGFISPPEGEEERAAKREKTSPYASLDIGVVDSVVLPPTESETPSYGSTPTASSSLLSGFASDTRPGSKTTNA